jgi:hypothetical protein
LKKRNLSKTEAVVSALVALAVLLAITGVFQPWFTVRTSPEFQLITNSSMSIEVNLFQTVTVTRTDGNVTDTLAFALSNDTAYGSGMFKTMTGMRTDISKTTSSDVNVTDAVNTTVVFTITDIGVQQGQITQKDENKTTFANSTGIFTKTTTQVSKANVTTNINQKAQLALTLDIAMILSGAGLATSLLAMALFLIVKTAMTRERYMYSLGMVGALLLFLAPLFMAVSVTGFWGSTDFVSGIVWGGVSLAVWGASTGWYLTFAASLILFACSTIIRAAYLDKKRALAIQTLK